MTQRHWQVVGLAAVLALMAGGATAQTHLHPGGSSSAIPAPPPPAPADAALAQQPAHKAKPHRRHHRRYKPHHAAPAPGTPSARPGPK